VSRPLKILLQVVLSVGLIVLVLYTAHPARVWHALQDFDPGWFAAALALNIAVTPLMAYRWQLLLQARGRRDVPLSWLTETYFVALLLGQVLPTAVGGDAVRLVDLARRTGARAEAAASIVVDRVVGTFALVVLAAAGGLLGGGSLSTGSVLVLELFLAAGCVFLAWLFLGRSARPLLRRLVPTARRLRIEGPARAVYDDLHAYRQHRSTLVTVLALAVLAQCLRVVVIAWLARGMGLDVGFGTFLLLGPVLFLVTVVPISLNGIGLREAAFVALLKGVGVSTADAFVLGLAFFAVGVLTAALGGAVLLRRALMVEVTA
jgi:glycosyltransferase 2 family protein